MPDIAPRTDHWSASDGYPIQVAVWSPPSTLRARVVVIHGVQSHQGWYPNLGRTLAEAGYEAHFPDRRGSGANTQDRGHTPSYGRLVDDIAEYAAAIRSRGPALPLAAVGISWGSKTTLLAAARHPQLIDAVAMICPGLQPRVGVSTSERLRIAFAFFTNRRKTFLVPLSDPALFTDSPDAQRYIANDPLALRQATAGLLAASTFIDRALRKALPKVCQPLLLMLAGHDRIVDNAKTLVDYHRIASADKSLIEYPEGHHTLEFDPNPSQYANDLVLWLDRRLSPNLPTLIRVSEESS